MNEMKIIPVFVPHVGCPNDCVFCNQRKITGEEDTPINEDYVHNIVEKHIKTMDDHVYKEIAFFGGSFTAIDIGLQEKLLSAAKYYKDLGLVKSIRCSTRPDAINEEILKLQKNYGVDTIELGIQSLHDEVLKESNRGHKKIHSVEASHLIKDKGFVLGHQVMLGLPASNREKDIKTCLESIRMRPDIVRIYPTLVIKDTDLSRMYREGLYKPLTIGEAVELSAYIYSLYRVNNIKVIRIGLQNTDSIQEGKDVEAGPFHPAFGQLVEESLYYVSLYSLLRNMDLAGQELVIHAPENLISNIVGQRKANINKLKKLLFIKGISFKKKEDKEDNVIEVYGSRKLGAFHKSEIFHHYLMEEGHVCI